MKKGFFIWEAERILFFLLQFLWHWNLQGRMHQSDGCVNETLKGCFGIMLQQIKFAYEHVVLQNKLF